MSSHVASRISARRNFLRRRTILQRVRSNLLTQQSRTFGRIICDAHHRHNRSESIQNYDVDSPHPRTSSAEIRMFARFLLLLQSTEQRNRNASVCACHKEVFLISFEIARLDGNRVVDAKRDLGNTSAFLQSFVDTLRRRRKTAIHLIFSLSDFKGFKFLIGSTEGVETFRSRISVSGRVLDSVGILEVGIRRCIGARSRRR